MKILVVGMNLRTIDNWVGAFELLQAQGAEIKTLLFPNTTDPSHVRLNELSYENLFSLPLTNLKNPSVSVLGEVDRAIEKTVAHYQPDLIFLASCQRWPATRFQEIVSLMPNRPVIVGAQHGFTQPWKSYRNNFCFDFFFAYGEGQKEHFEPEQRARVIAAGLPKLDRVKNTPNDYVLPARKRFLRPEEKGGGLFALLASRDEPSPRVLKRALAPFCKELGLRLLVRHHPQFVHEFRSLQSIGLIAETESDLYPQLKQCEVVFTIGSTIGLEAMAMQKRVIVFPSDGSEEYVEAGVVAKGVTAAALLECYQTQTAERRNAFFNKYLSGFEEGCSKYCAARLQEVARKGAATLL